MASVWLKLYLLIFLSTSTLCLDVSEIEVPTNDGVSGVFLIQTKTYQYSFDAATAKEACEAIKMRIATKAEVGTANKNGFQTCRFGWVEEQIAVLPRIEKNENCGKNSLGVSVWRADINKKFDVYCFKPAGSLETTSSRPQTSTGGRTPDSSSPHSSTQFLLQQTSASTGHPALSLTTTTNKPSVIVSTNDGISGVFLVQSENYQYSFDATTAKEACEAIKMRIATKAEVETANKNGFQTCRFGWVEEQIAVLPRVEKNENCGRNSLGVSAWRADINKKFDVYCFKPAGSLETTSSRPQTTTGGRTPPNNHYSTKTTYLSSTKSTPNAASTSRTLPPYTSTQSTPFTFSTSPTTFRTVSNPQINNSSQTTISPRFLPSPSTSPKFLTSFPSSSPHSSTQFLLQQTSASTVVPKTFVIISVIMLVLLLTAGGAAWFLKKKREQWFQSWIRLRPNQIMETEMFKRINERHCFPEQTNKDNNNWTYDNIILEMEQDPDML